jgi:hypothetical protein
MISFIYCKNPIGYAGLMEYHVVKASNTLSAVTAIIINNKFEKGYDHLLEFINKNYNKIIKSISCPDILSKLEQQKGLTPWACNWWENTEILVSLEEIFYEAISNKVFKSDALLNYAIKSSKNWSYAIYPVESTLEFSKVII